MDYSIDNMKFITLLAVLLISFNAYAQTILDYSDYMTSEDVEMAIDQLTTRYVQYASKFAIWPDAPKGYSITQLNQPSTAEGRPITGIKISNPYNNSKKSDLVFISLTHAREWITIGNTMYLAERLLKELQNVNSKIKDDLNYCNIWIIPVYNPDGFAYTQSINGDRYWRKNRKNNEDGTYGVDLNRNFPFKWGELTYLGRDTVSGTQLVANGSNESAHFNYRGPKANSELETQALLNFLGKLENLKAVISYHSYGQIMLRPYAYNTHSRVVPGFQTLDTLKNRSVKSIEEVHNINYKGELPYLPTGVIEDYVWDEFRAASFTMEVRPRGNLGQEGFSPNKSLILPCAEENYAPVVKLIHDAASTRLYIRDYEGDVGLEPSAQYFKEENRWSRPIFESPDISTNSQVIKPGDKIKIKVHINNATINTISNVKVDLYMNDPGINIDFPNLAGPFISNYFYNKESTEVVQIPGKTRFVPSSKFIGSKIVSVPPSGTDIEFEWETPTTPNFFCYWDYSVGAVIYHEDDLPLSSWVHSSSNIAAKTFVLTPDLD